MSTARRQAVAMAVVLIAMSSAVALSLAAAAPTAPKAITAAGVGAVRLGATYTSLRVAGLLGRIGPGCELGGPNTRSAPLRPPVLGGADLTTTSPRRVAAVTVAGGATARGVGVGAGAAAIRSAYPRMRLDHSSEQVFGITIARVPKAGGGPLEFALAKKTGKVRLIGIPAIRLCE